MNAVASCIQLVRAIAGAAGIDQRHVPLLRVVPVDLALVLHLAHEAPIEARARPLRCPSARHLSVIRTTFGGCRWSANRPGGCAARACTARSTRGSRRPSGRSASSLKATACCWRCLAVLPRSLPPPISSPMADRAIAFHMQAYAFPICMGWMLCVFSRACCALAAVKMRVAREPR